MYKKKYDVCVWTKPKHFRLFCRFVNTIQFRTTHFPLEQIQNQLKNRIRSISFESHGTFSRWHSAHFTVTRQKLRRNNWHFPVGGRRQLFSGKKHSLTDRRYRSAEAFELNLKQQKSQSRIPPSRGFRERKNKCFTSRLVSRNLLLLWLLLRLPQIVRWSVYVRWKTRRNSEMDSAICSPTFVNVLYNT